VPAAGTQASESAGGFPTYFPPAREQIMTNVQRTLFAAIAAVAFGAGSALAAAPEKDPGQKDANASQDVPMQQSTPSTAQTATSASAYEKFDAIDANRDGSIDKQEADASKALSAEFAKLDTNKDGKLSMTEFNNAKDLAAIKVDKNKAKGY